VAKSFLTILTPEEQARESIDGMLVAAGWLIQDRADANIDAGPGVAIREFALGHGFGEADYLLFLLTGRPLALSRQKRKAQPHWRRNPDPEVL
jgi:type I restriction enzyme R subunit